jgi:broad specificity phosphatase PhoE
MELTTLGRSIARLFGTKLPKNRIIRLFHSPVNRCKETAEEIHAGFEEIGGKSIFRGECSVVWKIGIDNKFFMRELQKYGDLDVFFRWASGFYKIETFPSLILYSQRAADVIWNQLKSAPKNGIDIYVTHDYHLNAFRYGWFGLPPDKRWVGYLGGFIFRSEKKHITYANFGEMKTIEAPHWWKKKSE